MKTFTKEQIAALAPYEMHFDTAIRAAWTRFPGEAGLKTIHSIYCETTGDRRRLNISCGTCVLNLVRDCGRLYYESKKALTEVKTTTEEFATIKKASVKTRKKKTE